MNRREFGMLSGAAAAGAPFPINAQQGVMPTVGWLANGSPTQPQSALQLRQFHQSLSAMGFVEDRNVAMEYRWAGDQNDLFPVLAADLVRRQVRVIVSNGAGPAALAAKGATATIPIVFQTGADPVASGLVASLNRPGGNLTGI